MTRQEYLEHERRLRATYREWKNNASDPNLKQRYQQMIDASYARSRGRLSGAQPDEAQAEETRMRDEQHGDQGRSTRPQPPRQEPERLHPSIPPLPPEDRHISFNLSGDPKKDFQDFKDDPDIPKWAKMLMTPFEYILMMSRVLARDLIEEFKRFFDK